MYLCFPILVCGLKERRKERGKKGGREKKRKGRRGICLFCCWFWVYVGEAVLDVLIFTLFSLNLSSKLKSQVFLISILFFLPGIYFFQMATVAHFLTFFKFLLKYHCIIVALPDHAKLTPTISLNFPSFIFFLHSIHHHVLH